MSKKSAKNNKKTNTKSVKGSKKDLGLIIGVIVAVLLVAAIVLTVALDRMADNKNAEFTSGTVATTDTAENTDSSETNDKKTSEEEKNMITEPVKVKVEMENGGSFVMELYPEYAPQTVQNFVDLVEDGFYDGVGFHRVIDGFMAQGGDPEGTGMGGSGTNIPGEFAANGFPQNTLSHQRGVVSMARSQNPDSASSQFFICYDDASFLDGQYAAFGKVIEGMEVVDSFLEVERVGMEGGTPTEPITMETVTIID